VSKDGIVRDLLIPGEKYVGELGVNIENQSFYYQLPKTCRCRRYITVSTATEYVQTGRAVWLLKKHKDAVIPDDHIWMPVLRERVPRVDLVTRSDIERAFTGSERKSRHWVYNRLSRRYVRVQTVPEGLTKAEWQREAEEEVKFERRIRSQYKNYIDEVHNLYMENRAKLIVPFRPDPFEGRCLFFSADQRTNY